MASIQFTRDSHFYAPIGQTFDITSIVAKHVGPYINYYSFNTDGTMAVLHTAGGVIVGWDHYLGDGTILQTATTSLPLQPLLNNMYGQNPSSIKAWNYLMSGNDTLTGSAARDVMDGRGGNDTLLGNGGNDRLLGGAGDDHLIGGAGRDLMTGGAGGDSFDFQLVSEGGDTITDFQTGIDHVTLAGSAFGFAGPLSDGVNFLSAAGGAVPVTAAPTLLYDSASGVLAYDADGIGAGASVVLAAFSNHAGLAAADFTIL